MFTSTVNGRNAVVIKSEDVADYYFIRGDEHVSVDRKTDRMDIVTVIFKSEDELEMLISKLELLREKCTTANLLKEVHSNDKVN